MDPSCPAMDRPMLECSDRPGCWDCTTEAAAEGCAGASEGNSGGAPAFSSSSSSLEGGSVNGDGDSGGGRLRQPRGKRGGERGGFWAGMRQESVWFERGVYERAESAYQAWLAARSPAPPAPSPSPSPPPPPCRHGDQVACHHLVASVWVNKSVFDSAERHFMAQAPPPSPPAPSSLAIAAPDEGYLSLTPTPPTPAHRPSVNGLPGLPPDLLRGVWLEKPRYDQAEASYYHRLCAPGPGPQPADARRPPSPAAAGQEVALCFLHALSESAWLEAPRFHAAERRFHERRAADTAAGAHAADLPPSESETPAPSMPCADTMTGVDFLAQEKIWFDKFRYDEAECRFYERLNGPTHSPQDTGANTILQDIARARQNIQKSLAGMKTSLQPGKGRSRTPQNRRSQPGVACGAGDQGELITRMTNLELENQSLHRVVEDLRSALSKLESRVALLEKRPAAASAPPPTATPACVKTAPAPLPKARAPVEEDDDDELDLFGSDEEDDEEAERIREERVKQYAEKKAKKPALIAKSSILLDVKPWDDETDMARLEECVRSVQLDGLLWGSSKLVPVGYGIRKLQIQCVVEDDKVGTDMLEEEITKFEDYVQSVDVAAFNKI